eukprot:4318811-Pyramimonas_sp.AAC.1
MGYAEATSRDCEAEEQVMFWREGATGLGRRALGIAIEVRRGARNGMPANGPGASPSLRRASPLPAITTGAP